MAWCSPPFISIGHNLPTDSFRANPWAPNTMRMASPRAAWADVSSPFPHRRLSKTRQEHLRRFNFQMLVGHARLRRQVMEDNFRRAPRAPAESRADGGAGGTGRCGRGGQGFRPGSNTSGQLQQSEMCLRSPRLPRLFTASTFRHCAMKATAPFDSFREAISHRLRCHHSPVPISPSARHACPCGQGGVGG